MRKNFLEKKSKFRSRLATRIGLSSVLSILGVVFCSGIALAAEAGAGEGTQARADSPEEGYLRALAVLKQATVEVNNARDPELDELERALDEIREFAPLLAADRRGRRAQIFAELALARVAVERGQNTRAEAIMARILQGLELSGELEDFPVDVLGPELEQLYALELQSLRAAERGRLMVRCARPCRVFVDEREVAQELVTGPGVELTVGEHRVWIAAAEDADAAEPLRSTVDIARAGERYPVRFGGSEPPAPGVSGPPGPPASVDAPSDRVAPRWSEIGLVSLGVVTTGAGAALWAVDGSCPGGGDSGDFATCPQLLETDAAGISMVVAGSAVLLTGAVMLAIDERRARRRSEREPHPLALRPGRAVQQ